jgi:hypothetical protein
LSALAALVEEGRPVPTVEALGARAAEVFADVFGWSVRPLDDASELGLDLI